MVLSILASLTTVAKETEQRRDEIKSHGVLVETDGTQEVRLDSSDLYYLADQMDTLEQYYKQYAEEQYEQGYTDGKSICSSIDIIKSLKVTGHGNSTTDRFCVSVSPDCRTLLTISNSVGAAGYGGITSIYAYTNTGGVTKLDVADSLDITGYNALLFERKVTCRDNSSFSDSATLTTTIKSEIYTN